MKKLLHRVTGLNGETTVHIDPNETHPNSSYLIIEQSSGRFRPGQFETGVKLQVRVVNGGERQIEIKVWKKASNDRIDAKYFSLCLTPELTAMLQQALAGDVRHVEAQI
jgi:hypothetical protein